MSGKIKLVAKRIKELRRIAKLSAAEVASSLKIAKNVYQKYESGTRDIPVSVLYEIAHKFNVELTALLTGDEPRLHTYCLVKKNTAASVDRRKEYKYQDLAYNFSHKKAEVFLVTVEPKPKETGVHFYSHPGQEFNYVLEGKLKVILEGREVILEEGDSLFFNSGLKHAMRAHTNKTVRFLAVIL